MKKILLASTLGGVVGSILTFYFQPRLAHADLVSTAGWIANSLDRIAKVLERCGCPGR